MIMRGTQLISSSNGPVKRSLCSLERSGTKLLGGLVGGSCMNYYVTVEESLLSTTLPVPRGVRVRS